MTAARGEPPHAQAPDRSDLSDPSPIDPLLRRLYARTRGGAPRDPARARRLIDRLGLRLASPWIHVVGTNGKGSVAARLDAGLRAAGRRPLRFLSPHVERFHERIAVDGVEVRDDEIRRFLARAWHDEPEPPAAFFELVLGLALEVGAARNADAAVIEAGVGAARDATAALRDARLVVLTDVGEDHLAWLGPTIADVARDKAQAIVPGRPVVSGAQGEALELVRSIARERGAPLHVLPGPESRCGRAGTSDPLFAWPPGVRPATGVQARSGRLAVAGLRLLGLPPEVSDRALRAAAADPQLPARRERFALGDGRVVWLDGAHNPAAIAALAEELPDGAHVLLGVAARKDVAAVRAAFAGSPRLLLTAAIAGERPWGEADGFVADPEEALTRALAGLPRGGTLVVTGSFHLAGRLRPLLRRTAVDGRSG